MNICKTREEKKHDQDSMRSDEIKNHGLSFFLFSLILSLICIHLCIQQNIYYEKKKTWHTFHFRL